MTVRTRIRPSLWRPRRVRADTLARQVLVVVLSAAPSQLDAQTNERAYEEYAFRLVTPGARAVGMGRTFTGLADDATAAFSNPAGLSNLLEPELSLEVTGNRIRNDRVTSISATGALGIQRFGDFVTSPSFLSVVWPVKDFTLSAFRQQLQKYREDFTLDGLRLIPNADPVSQFTPEAFSEGAVSLTAASYGIGMAYVVSDKVSIGSSLAVTRARVNVRSQSGCPTTLPWYSVVDGVRQSPPPLCPASLTGKGFIGATTTGESTGVSGIVGVQVKPWATLSFGAAFYRGASLQFRTTLQGKFTRSSPPRVEYAVDTSPPGRFSGCQPRLEGTNLTLDLTGCSAPLRYRIPDKLSVGVSWSPRREYSVVADIGRTFYSQIVTGEFLIVDYNDPRANLKPSNYYIDDATEVHLGGEYRLYARSATVAIRVGLFTDPSHALRFRPPRAHELIAQASGFDPDIGNPSAVVAEDFRFNMIRPSTDVGVTGGFGIAVANGVQFDLGGSWSSDAREVVASAVLRFCRVLRGKC